jgi:hypothetical protein
MSTFQLDKCSSSHRLVEACRKEGNGDALLLLEFPTKSGHGVKLYSVCSYSAGETYPSDECRRRVL